MFSFQVKVAMLARAVNFPDILFRKFFGKFSEIRVILAKAWML